MNNINFGEQLIEAVEHNNYQKINRILTNKIVKYILPDIINYKNDHGDTPLIIACKKIDVSLSLIKFLLSIKGIILNIQNNDGETPLIILCREKKGKDYNIILELLNYEININLSDNNGNTALHYAIGIMPSLYVSYLLLNTDDSSIQHKNNLGQTPLMLAFKYNDIKCINLLLSKYNNIEKKIIYTFNNSFIEMSERNLYNIFNTEIVDIFGDTTLMYVFKYSSNYIIFKVLKCIDYKNIHKKNNTGETILNFASKELVNYIEYYDDLYSQYKSTLHPYYNSRVKMEIISTLSLINKTYFGKLPQELLEEVYTYLT